MVFGEVSARKAEAFILLISGSKPYINDKKNCRHFLFIWTEV
jgi:hypothetical protein